MKNNFLKISLATFFVVIGSCLLSNFDVDGGAESVIQDDKINVFTLENGLKIIVCPKKDASIVSVQLWYNVGSKHEKDGERGIAHLIEHMIFKGTAMLSESDIAAVTSKLSGYCNAFTGYDYTGYLFNLPVANWDKVLPIMADCMQNCTFKQEHLNSEMKAVIQELKMNRDNYTRSMWFEMITNLFESHPYHYPIIGYKQDLWSVSRDTLEAFYKKYYTPDNAVMVVVGDVNPTEVYESIKKEFESIPAGCGWNEEPFYVNEDIKTKVISLYRKVAQPKCSMVYMAPGFMTGNQFDLEVLGYALAEGKGSRLYRLLVDDLQLVTGVNAEAIDLFEYTLFWIDFSPKSQQDIDLIVRYIQEQIDDIAQGGLTEKEVARAQRFAQLSYQQTLQNSRDQAYKIGKAYIAMKDPFYTLHYGKNDSIQQLAEKLKIFTAQYCTAVHCHQGRILPIPGKYENVLQQLQEKSDQQDSYFLGLKTRDALVEPVRYAPTVELNKDKEFRGQTAQNKKLDNGMELIWSHNQSIDFIEIQIELKANHLYDPAGLEGLSSVVSRMMVEGTQNYPGKLFNDELDNFGMSCSVQSGFISLICLQQDIEKALSLMTEMLTQATLEQLTLEKMKEKALVDLKQYWDAPTLFRDKLARDIVYKNHPYSKIPLGSKDGIAAITVEDCRDFYRNMMTPQKAYCVIVGNLENSNIEDLIEKTIGQWQGPVIEDIKYPSLTTLEKEEFVTYANRDQVVLAFAGLSIDRMHKDYDKVLLFDQILTGSVMGSMNTRLFQLRQQSGLFYTVGGSLLAGATDQPGMISIRTIVSKDRTQEAQNAFVKLLDEAIDSFSQEELDEARRTIINSCALNFETNTSKASTFLFLKKYNLSDDYFEQRIAALKNITLEDVKIAVKKILSSDKLAVIKIGRQ
ncbi:insulinase family protein [Candidatus Babeliales bacterium]|nr:insulinase family protein [Candidatus Babeliales bacterium]MBP9843473.1 insulinase family protein [Candidatus Babeliales bacterium]